MNNKGGMKIRVMKQSRMPAHEEQGLEGAGTGRQQPGERCPAQQEERLRQADAACRACSEDSERDFSLWKKRDEEKRGKLQ